MFAPQMKKGHQIPNGGFQCNDNQEGLESQQLLHFGNILIDKSCWSRLFNCRIYSQFNNDDVAPADQFFFPLSLRESDHNFELLDLKILSDRDSKLETFRTGDNDFNYWAWPTDRNNIHYLWAIFVIIK